MADSGRTTYQREDEGEVGLLYVRCELQGGVGGVTGSRALSKIGLEVHDAVHSLKTND